MLRQTLIISAFCGTGKTHICENSNKKIIEFECWKYDKDAFPNNCVADIKSKFGKVDIIFISTNPLVLDVLIRMGKQIILIYPELKLKNEYMNRYRNRGSSNDFMLMLSKYWDTWLREIKENKNCQHIRLKTGEYITDVLTEAFLVSV